VFEINKYKVYKDFEYKGRKFSPQKTGIFKSGNNVFTFQVRTKSGKWLDAFHIFEKDYASAKTEAKKYINKHNEILHLKKVSGK